MTDKQEDIEAWRLRSAEAKRILAERQEAEAVRQGRLRTCRWCGVSNRQEPLIRVHRQTYECKFCMAATIALDHDESDPDEIRRRSALLRESHTDA
jgi:hypothetical protein